MKQHDTTSNFMASKSLLVRELGIGVVAYSPLGRGFLSSGTKVLEQLSQDDFRQVCVKACYYRNSC